MTTTPPQYQAPLIDTTAKNQTLDSIYNPQTQFIQSQIDKLPQYYDAQKASIEQAKVNAFRDIGNTAQSRGMFFSGFQPHENARYLGEKYLPGLMEIDNKMDKERTGLLGQIVGLNADRGQQMLGYYDKNDERVYDGSKINYGTNTDWWNTQQNWAREDTIRAQDQAWQKELSEFEAQLSLKYAPRSSSSGYSSGGSSSSKFDPAITSQIDSVLSSVTGSDGKVSPADYNQAKSLWYSKGGDIEDFNAIFAPRYAHGATSPIQQYIGG